MCNLIYTFILGGYYFYWSVDSLHTHTHLVLSQASLEYQVPKHLGSDEGWEQQLRRWNNVITH